MTSRPIRITLIAVYTLTALSIWQTLQIRDLSTQVLVLKLSASKSCEEKK